METSSATQTSSSQGTGGLANSTSLAETFDNFLVLLTTQLENQDPLSPLDTNQFTEQLVQFTAVEQALKTNSKLDELITLQNASKLNNAASFIGKRVEAETLVAMLKDGSATMTYTLSGNADKTTITIVDENGQTVRTLTGETGEGHHEITWDGKNQYGVDLEDGVYGFVVLASDAEGEEVPSGQGTIGTVTSVEVIDEELYLNLDKVQIPLDSIIKIGSADDQEATT